MITEVVFKQEYYQKTCEEWVRGGRMFVTPKGHNIPIGINSQDVSNIVTEDAYESFISTTNPKFYIKNGTWYDGKEHKKVRREKWKEEEMEERLKISLSQQKNISSEKVTELLEKNKPDFIRKTVN